MPLPAARRGIFIHFSFPDTSARRTSGGIWESILSHLWFLIFLVFSHNSHVDISGDERNGKKNKRGQVSTFDIHSHNQSLN
jgi:hypothetical protein